MRLAQEAEAFATIEEPLPETGWTWVTRYTIGVLLACALGGIMGGIDLFKRTEFSSYALTAADIARFLGYGGALLLLGYMGLKAAGVLRHKGPGAERLANLLVPFTALFVSSAGYRVSLVVALPMLSSRSRGTYDWIFVLAIGASALWLAYTIFHQSERLTDLLKFKSRRGPAPNACVACGTKQPGNGTYCAECGAPRDGFAKAPSTIRRRSTQPPTKPRTRS